MPEESGSSRFKLDVGTVCYELSNANKGTSTSLHDGSATSSRPPRFNQVKAWERKRIRLYQKELTKENLQDGLFHLAKCQANDTVYSISGERKTLMVGTLKLRPHCYLVLDKTCRDCRFKDMVIKDGTVVCYGSRNTSFNNVKFQGCSLVVISGASVTLQGVSFNHDTSAHSGLSIFASGEQTIVHADSSSIQGGLHGAMVHTGARFEGFHLTVERVLVAGIEVRGHGSALEMEDSSFSKFASLEEHLEGTWSFGVVVRTPLLPEGNLAGRLTRVRTNKVGIAFCAEEQGSMELDECASEADMMGCFSRSYGLIRSRNLTITAAERYAFVVRRGGTASLVESTIQRSKNAALYVDGAGSEVDIIRCKFLRNAKVGALVCNDGVLNADTCESQGNKSAGYMVQGPARLELTDSTSMGDCRGCCASSGGKLKARDVIIRSSTKEGFHIQSGGHADISRCTVSKVGEEGVYVANEKSWVKMNDCAVMQPNNACVFFVHGATGCLQSCKLSPWIPKAAVQARNEGTKVEVLYCTVEPKQRRLRLRDMLSKLRRTKCACASMGADAENDPKQFWAVDGATIDVHELPEEEGSGTLETKPDDNALDSPARVSSGRSLAAQSSTNRRSWKDGSDTSCIICMMRPKNAGFVHGDILHFCACHTCAEKWFARKRSCPLCKKAADGVMWVQS